MPSPPTATSFALLGLLGVQPWTAYELVGQAQRSLHHFWPRSEAHLYAELKRLVERGHADAEVVEGRRRQRTRYTITPLGRTALEDWLGTEPAPPTLEVEGLLACCWVTREPQRICVLRSKPPRARSAICPPTAWRSPRSCWQPAGRSRSGFHLTERVVSFYGEFLLLLKRWCDETLAEVETWPDTRDIGLTPPGRERLERLLARARQDP